MFHLVSILCLISVSQFSKWCTINTELVIFELTTFKMTFRDRVVVRERRFRALVLQNHPKSTRFFEHSENNLT
jgi:hypothetical protein